MPQTTEERRLLTILFADLSGFSTLSSELDPEDVKDVVNTCFTYLNKPIIKEGGTIHKYEGDLVIALFGLPLVHEDDPERAIRASLEMIALVPEINRVLSAKLKRPTSLDLHVGINSGTVFVGEIGSQDKKEYTVMGDVVNIASRLKDVAPKGEIIVSEPVFRSSRYLFDYEARPAVNLKGIKEPVRIYRPRKIKDHPEPKRGIKGLYSPMLGRDRELAALKAAKDRLYRGEGGITFVLGAAGMGKTRLLDELKNYAGADGPTPLLTLEGRCFSYGESMAYGPFLQILEQLLGVTEHDTRETFQEKLLARVKSIFPDEWREIVPYLGYIFSIRFASEIDEKVKFLDAQGLKLQIMIAIKKLFFALARQKPLLLVIDDYHWIDNESLALLEFALDPGTADPSALPSVLFIALSRIEKEVAHYETKERLKKKLAGRCQEIVLQPLDAAESTQLVYNLLNVPGITQGFKDRILTKAEGNPFYVEEIIRSLIDGGILIFAEGVWSLSQGPQQLDSIRIPDSVQAVIASRLDKLNQDTRDILQMAAVIGRNFYGPVLEQLCSLDAMLLTVYLAALEDYEYITELKRRPEAEYSFRHPLFQEVAYSNLLIKRRRELHRRIGELIEKIYPDRLEEFTDVLAYQYANSDDTGKAMEWLKKAGFRAKDRYANDLAIGYFEKLARLIRESKPDLTGELAAACEALGDIHRLKAEYPKAEQYYEEMFQAAGPDRITRSRARRKVVPLRHDQGDYDGAMKILDEVEPMLTGDSAAEKVEKAEVRVARCWVLHLKGDMKKAISEGEAAFEIVDELIRSKAAVDIVRLKRLRMAGLSNLSSVYRHLGEYDRAIKVLEESMAIADKLGDKLGVGIAMGNLGGIYYEKGEDRKAIEHYRHYLKTAQEIGDKRGVALVTGNMGRVFHSQGEDEKAIEYFNQSLKIDEEMSDRRGIAVSHINLGNLYKDRGDYEAAIKLYESAYDKFTELGEKYGAAACRGNIGTVYESTGDYGRAEDLYRESIRIFEELDDKKAIGIGYAFIAGLHEVKGEFDKADESFRRSLELFERIGDKRAIGMTYCSLGGLALASGDLTRARSDLVKAGAILEEVGDPFELMKLYRIRAELGISEAENSAGLEEARQYADRASALARDSKSKLEVASAYLTEGRVYARFGDIKKAGESLKAAIVAFEAINNKKLLADAFLASARLKGRGAKAAFDRAEKLYAELHLENKVKEVNLARGS